MDSSNELYALTFETIQSLGNRTVSVAESLTGGLISAALTEVPGASKVFRGSVVSYATDIKVSVLGVDAELIAKGGAVQAQVALEMAQGVGSRFASDFAIAVTGVAGPASQDRQDPGTVFIAGIQFDSHGVVVNSCVEALTVDLTGVTDSRQRQYVRSQSVEYALSLLHSLASVPVSE